MTHIASSYRTERMRVIPIGGDRAVLATVRDRHHTHLVQTSNSPLHSDSIKGVWCLHAAGHFLFHGPNLGTTYSTYVGLLELLSNTWPIKEDWAAISPMDRLDRNYKYSSAQWTSRSSQTYHPLCTTKMKLECTKL